MGVECASAAPRADDTLVDKENSFGADGAAAADTERADDAAWVWLPDDEGDDGMKQRHLHSMRSEHHLLRSLLPLKIRRRRRWWDRGVPFWSSQSIF